MVSLVSSSIEKNPLEECLLTLKSVCRAGKASPGIYSLSLTDALLAYPSSGYLDDMAWGAVWLYKATNNDSYLSDAQELFTAAQANTSMSPPTPLAWNWDNQLPGVAFMLAEYSHWQNQTIIAQVNTASQVSSS